MANDHTHPADHAFVIRFRAGSTRPAHGRVEHVVSGRGVRFVSWDEMVGFMRRVLRERATRDDSGDAA